MKDAVFWLSPRYSQRNKLLVSSIVPNRIKAVKNIKAIMKLEVIVTVQKTAPCSKGTGGGFIISRPGHAIRVPPRGRQSGYVVAVSEAWHTARLRDTETLAE